MDVMSEIHVKFYAGYRAGQRPVQFTFHGRTFDVTELDDQWYSPDAIYFRVRANDGQLYVLRHDEGQGFWTLEAFRADKRY